MTTCASFLTRAKLVYSDHRSPKLTDQQYWDLAALALQSISRDAPKKSSSTLTTNGTTVTFLLPTDFVRLQAIHLNDGSTISVLRDAQTKPGDQIRVTATGIPEYRLPWPQEDSVTFTRAPTATEVTTLHYLAAWPALAPAGSLPFGTRVWLEEALTLYLGYLAFLSHAAGRAQNEQWSAKPELTVDNPLEQQARLYMEGYQRLMAANR